MFRERNGKVSLLFNENNLNNSAAYYSSKIAMYLAGGCFEENQINETKNLYA